MSVPAGEDRAFRATIARMPRVFCVLALVSLAGCAATHTRGEFDAGDAAPPRNDAFAFSRDAMEPRIDVAIVDAAPDTAPDAFLNERTFTLRLNECFAFADERIQSFEWPMRCPDMSFEGPSYLAGIDGTLCPLEGTYPTLDSIPTTPSMFCGRVINLPSPGPTTLVNAAFYVLVDATHRYRVHVIRVDPAIPEMVFSYDQL